MALQDRLPISQAGSINNVEIVGPSGSP